MGDQLSASLSDPECDEKFFESFRLVRKCLLQTDENVARKK